MYIFESESMASSAANNTGADQTAPMCSLISAFVVHIGISHASQAANILIE